MWLDRAIGWLSPAWGLNRLRSRAALQVLARNYEGARITRRTSGWSAGGTSANAEIAPALATLRNRSRDAVRNNPYAKRAIAKLVSASIGTGILAQPPATVENVWKRWCQQADFEGQLDFYGLQMLIGRTVFESGECLVRRIREGGKYAGEVPLKIQVLEPDYIDSTRVGPTTGGNYIIAGVEIDPQGRRVAYWLWDKHPGEYNTFPMTLQSRRYDASEILHIYEKERPGQLRGVPRLSVSLMKLRDLDEYEEAELVRKKIEACFAAFVTSAEGSRTLAQPETTTSGAGVTTRTETVSPGMIEYLKPGEEVNFGSPSSGSGYGDYTSTQLHAIAAGVGVTYEQLTGDLSGVNYSSMRGGMLEFRELTELFRWIYFIPMACQPIFDWFVDAAWTAGKVRTNSYDGVVWTPPKWDWIDPLKDVQGEKLETISGFKTISAILRGRGLDPKKVFQEYKEERELLKSLGLTFDSSSITAKQVDSASADDSAPAGDAAGEANKGEAANAAALNVEALLAAVATRAPQAITLQVASLDAAAKAMETTLERMGELNGKVADALERAAQALGISSRDLVNGIRGVSSDLGLGHMALADGQKALADAVGELAAVNRMPTEVIEDADGRAIGTRKVEQLKGA